MVIMMLKKISIITICISFVLFSANHTSGQSLEVGYGHFGTMIYWEGEFPAGANIEIARTHGDRSSEEVRWSVRPAQTAEEFLRYAEERTPPVFKGVIPFNEESASFYVETFARESDVDKVTLTRAPNILFALGLAVWDTTAAENTTYRYRILVDGVAIDDGDILETELNEVDDWQPAFHSTSHNEPVIRSRWYIPDEYRGDVYTFLAYRSPPFETDYRFAGGFRGFEAVGDSLLAAFTDTTLARPGVYHHVIRPADRYGKMGPVSEYAQGANFPPTAEPMVTDMNAVGMEDSPAIQLEWRVVNHWRLRSLALYRGRTFEGPYELVRHFSPEDSTYLDPVDEVMEAYWYYFEMNDIARPEPIESVKIPAISDYSWPAAVPDSVAAVVDGPEIIIHWKRAGYQDRGYYVMRTQGFGEPDQMVSEFIHTDEERGHYEWTDTTAAHEPGHTYTYAVISESIGYEKSELSEIVHARPDVPIFVPAPTDLKLGRTGDSTFLLSWSDHSADESLHHMGYRVYQKDDRADDGFRLITPEMLLFETNSLELEEITPADTFVVKAFNIYDDESAFSNPVALHDPYFYHFGPEYLMGRNEGEGIRVSWNQPLRENISGYTLYRIDEADEQMQQVAELDNPSQTDWLDRQVTPGQTYYYFITAHDTTGLSSEASELLNIRRHGIN